MAAKTFSCPYCGKDVPVKARACPHCGSCEKTGWKEGAGDTDGLDLPDEDFDYEKFKEEEFGTPRKMSGKELFWKAAAIGVLILTILGFFVQFLSR